MVAATALAASVTHLVEFASVGGDSLSTVASIAAFSVPGVIIGGQIGPQISKRVPGQKMIRSLGGLFLIVGLVTLVEAFAG